MTDPLETLQEISNHFEITYTNFQDHGREVWIVKIINTDPTLTGQGDTLPEAVKDAFRQREFNEFKTQLQRASIGNKSVDEWKAKIREIL